MKSILFRSVILLSIISFLVSPALAFSEGDPLIVDLIAGQNEVAGNIKVWDDGSSLFVSYEIFEPWCLTETHLAVASSVDEIPQSNGNPVPGQFPYKNSHKCATNFLYKIPLDNNVCTLYIAAHAAVKRPGSNETAWGSGLDFPGKNWGTYFTYEPNACNVTPSPTDSETPTSTPPTPTETPSPTDTPPTPTETATETPSPTDTPPTPTDTATMTPSPTESVTPTPSPTDTPTPTPSPTDTPPACQPTVVVADFSQIAVGQSVEGMGVVAPDLNIDAIGTAVKIMEGVDPSAYTVNVNGETIINGGLVPGGGFSDIETRLAILAHQYTFTFASGVSASHFSLHMQDYGDWNPTASTSHQLSATAYDINGFIVSRQEINYTTPGVTSPTSSSIFGDLSITGDAATASPGDLGNWTWNLYGTGIVKVVLEFGEGYDPAFGLDLLSYTTDCGMCQPVTVADFSQIAVGQSVEGMGVVAPDLNIDAIGTAVKIMEGVDPSAYTVNVNGETIINGGLVPGGGFSDIETRLAILAHQYTFTFASGVSASHFSLHMQDYGDWNPTASTSHQLSATAYDINGFIVSRQEINYTTPGVTSPTSSSIFGDLSITGDAATASPGDLGNWTWNLYGTGIVKVVLEFGEGYDPAFGLDLLSYTTDCDVSTTSPQLGFRYMSSDQHIR